MFFEQVLVLVLVYGLSCVMVASAFNHVYEYDYSIPIWTRLLIPLGPFTILLFIAYVVIYSILWTVGVFDKYDLFFEKRGSNDHDA